MPHLACLPEVQVSRDEFPDEPTIADLETTPVELEGPQERRRPVLRVLRGLEAGRIAWLEDGLVVGRAEDVGLRLPDESISRRHCQVLFDDMGRPCLRDLGSTNGTRVNGRVVGRTPVPLDDGDVVQLGSSVVLKLSWQGQLEAELETSLYRSAVSDALTGAYNRRYFHDRLGAEFSWARRHGRPLCLAVLDIDHFKRVNDEHGHDAGDAVLRRIADVVQREIRREDVLARYGGEEFVVLMRDTPVERGAVVAERIRLRVAGQPIEHRGRVLRVTVSIGVASTADPGVDDPLELFAAADRHLYAAKEGGRNRVCSRLGRGATAADGA